MTTNDEASIMANIDLIKIDTDLVSLSAVAVDDRIMNALNKLSQTIAQNGQALESLVTKVELIEQRCDKTASHMNSSVKEVELKANQHKSELVSLKEEMSAIRQDCLWKEEFKKIHDQIKVQQSHLSSRVGLIEKGDCPTLSTNILTSVEKMSNEKFTVFEKAMKQILEISNADLSKIITTKVDESVKLLQQQTASLLAQHRLQLEALFSKKVSELEETMKCQNIKVANILASIFRELARGKDDVGEFIYSLVRRYSQGLNELSGAVRVLYDTLMLDISTCFQLCNFKTQPDVTMDEKIPLRLEVEFDKCLLSNSHHGQSISHDSDAVVTIEQLHTTINDLAEFEEERRCSIEAILKSPLHVVSFEGLTERFDEKKVAYIAKLPQSVNMRFMVQREIGDRVDLLRSEVHHDMVTELLDMQRELKGKVAATKLHELLDAHRDEQLYNTVKTLVADLQDVRACKLDIQHFVDALKEKADIKLLDNKVDVVDLSVQVDSINNTTERLGRELTKATEKHRNLESSVQNLHQYVLTGGGVYSAVAELNGKLSASTSLHQQQIKFGGPTAQMTSSAFNIEGSRSPKPTSGMSISDNEVKTHDDKTVSSSYSSMPRGGALTSMASSLGVRPTAAKSEMLLDILKKSETSDELSGPLINSTVVGPRNNGTNTVEGSLRDDPDWVTENSPSSNLTPNKPKVRRPNTGGSSSASSQRHIAGKDRLGSAAAGGDRSPKTEVNHHLPGGQLSQNEKHSLPPALPIPRSVAAIPMTASQKEYCDSLGLDAAATIKALQAATPNVTVREARGVRYPK